jgi:hypothetical protein
LRKEYAASLVRMVSMLFNCAWSICEVSSSTGELSLDGRCAGLRTMMAEGFFGHLFRRRVRALDET